MQGELPILSNDSSGDLLLQNHDSVHNPELEEESIYYKPSQHATALTIGSNLVSALETGLRFANVISSSSFHMAASINSATADFADRRITVTADQLTSFTDGLSNKWQESIQNRIQFGSSKLKDVVTSLTSGVGKALSVAHGLTSSGINWSLETVKRVDQGLETALTAAGIPLTGHRRRHGLLQAAHAMLEVLTPLSNISPLDVGKALGVIAMVQESSCMPYPPAQHHGTLIDLEQRHNRDFMNELTYRCRQTLSVYTPGLLRLCQFDVKSASPSDLIPELLGVDAEAIFVKRGFSEMNHPAHFVILDHSSRSICVIIRGSTEAVDILTDLCCQPDPIFGSHSGMQSSAASIDNHIRTTVHELCEQHPDYKVIIEGHSLGGGTATLLCLLWLRDPIIGGPDGQRLHAYSFGAPAVIPLKTALKYRQNITSVVYGCDIVSRVSWGSINNLNKVIVYLCSKERSPNQLLNSTPSSSSLLIAPQSSDTEDFLISRFYSLDGSTSDSFISIDSPRLESSIKHSNFQSSQPNAFSLQSSPSTLPLQSINPDCSTSNNTLQLNRPSSSSPSTSFQSIISGNRTNPFLSEHLNSLSISTLLHLLEARNSLRSSASYSSRDFLDSQIKLAAAALQTLHSSDDVLSIAGRCILVMPVEHYQRAEEKPPQYLTHGGCVLIELDNDEALAAFSQDIIVRREALSDHLPPNLGKALGINFVNQNDLCSSSVEEETELCYLSSVLRDYSDSNEPFVA